VLGRLAHIQRHREETMRQYDANFFGTLIGALAYRGIAG
jgi:hypothetical protein